MKSEWLQEFKNKKKDIDDDEVGNPSERENKWRVSLKEKIIIITFFTTTEVVDCDWCTIKMMLIMVQIKWKWCCTNHNHQP